MCVCVCVYVCDRNEFWTMKWVPSHKDEIANFTAMSPSEYAKAGGYTDLADWIVEQSQRETRMNVLSMV